MKNILLITGALVLIHLPAFALNDSEITEIMKTANNAEIDAAKVAKKQAADSQAKDFAEMMIKDHEENLKDVKKIADKEKLKMKSSDESNSDMHKNLLNDLDNKLIPKAQNQSLKTYLQSTKEAVQKHLSKAQQIQSGLH